MTVDALRSKSRRRRRLDEPEPMPIGEADSEIFDCPTCSRPLASGTRRCPACSTRLIDGIKATKAAEFVIAGLLIGGLVGGGTVGAAVAVTSSLARSTPTDAAVGSPADPVLPSGAPAASAEAPVIAPGMPAAAVSALRQSALLNDRLAAEGHRLVAALEASRPASVDIARALRALAANAAFGDRIAPDIGIIPEAVGISTALVDTYARIGATARAGLAASLNNTAAYVDAGEGMVDVLATLGALDAEARVIASQAGIELPPVSAPADDTD